MSRHIVAILWSAMVLGVAGSAHAVVVVPTPEGQAYLACVVREADTDTAVRSELLKAVARLNGQYSGLGKQVKTNAPEPAWIKFFDQKIVPSCGRAPKFPIAYDVVPYRPDERPSAVIATDLVRSWSDRIKRDARGQLIWSKK